MPRSDFVCRNDAVLCVQAEFAADPNFVYSERITLQQSVALLRVPTNLLVFIQGMFGCLPWGVLLTYLTDYLAQNKGLSVPTATIVRPCYVACRCCDVCLLAVLHDERCMVTRFVSVQWGYLDEQQADLCTHPFIHC